MKKLLIIAMVMLLSTSFKNEQQKLTWVSDFSIFVNERGNFVVYYKGRIDQCMSKKILDIMYQDCDTLMYNEQQILDSLKIELDTCREEAPLPKKIKETKWI